MICNIWFRDQKLINCSTAKQKFIIWAFFWHFFSKCLSARLFSFCRNQEMAIIWVLVELDFETSNHCIAWKVFVFGLFLIRIFQLSKRYSVSLRIQSKCGKIQNRKTPNTDTFHAVLRFFLFHFIQANKSIRELLDVVYCDCDIRNYV